MPLAFAFLLVMSFLSCIQPAKEEEAAVKVSLEAARNAAARTYAPRKWADAERALAIADRKLEKGEVSAAEDLFLAAEKKESCFS